MFRALRTAHPPGGENVSQSLALSEESKALHPYTRRHALLICLPEVSWRGQIEDIITAIFEVGCILGGSDSCSLHFPRPHLRLPLHCGRPHCLIQRLCHLNLCR